MVVQKAITREVHGMPIYFISLPVGQPKTEELLSVKSICCSRWGSSSECMITVAYVCLFGTKGWEREKEEEEEEEEKKKSVYKKEIKT